VQVANLEAQKASTELFTPHQSLALMENSFLPTKLMEKSMRQVGALINF
jgi:hypothetical protein